MHLIFKVATLKVHKCTHHHIIITIINTIIININIIITIIIINSPTIIKGSLVLIKMYDGSWDKARPVPFSFGPRYGAPAARWEEQEITIRGVRPVP